MPDRPTSNNPDQETAALRVLDAAANRAGEGLRVVEDYVRFVLDDVHLTRHVKQMRHALARSLEAVPATLRHAARDTRADVGTRVTTPDEATRTSSWDVCAAALKRVEQSLRSLEEFAKVLGSDADAGFEQLRYQTYTLERAIGTTRANCERLQHVELCVLVDGRDSPREFERLVRAILAGGAQMIQLRDKRLDDRRLVDRARLLTDVTRQTDVLAIINDRLDVARLSHADGVHLGQTDLGVKDARTVLGPQQLVGVSTHSIEQAREAVLDGASYIGVGPTFPSSTKAFDTFVGTELLRAAAEEISLPALAIGGISADNVHHVLDAGIRRVAVGAAVTGSSDPTRATADLLQKLAAQPADTDHGSSPRHQSEDHSFDQVH